MKNNSDFWTVDKFFERLDYLLNKKGWTFNQLSLEADLGTSSVYQMRRRKALPSFFSLCCICDALEVSIKEFFDIEEAKIFDTNIICEKLENLSDESKKIIIQLLEQLK